MSTVTLEVPADSLEFVHDAVARRIESAEKWGADPTLLLRPPQKNCDPKARQFVTTVATLQYERAEACLSTHRRRLLRQGQRTP